MEGQSDRSERPDSRVTGEKRDSMELGENDEIACKHVKMRGFSTENSNSLKNEKHIDPDQFKKEGMSQIALLPVTLKVGGSKEERTDKKHDGPLDLNTEAFIPNNPSSHSSLDDAKNCGKQSLVRIPYREGNYNCITSRGLGLDVNVEGFSSSVNRHPSKNHRHISSSDVSECGSTTGPLEDNEPLRRWKEMKENGFVSASFGGKPAPKQRMRRTKAEMLKKKIEIAKREQVDRFTKIAAPSGLLNELNPGIINHVRNRKQVHSIIESLVRSEKLENGHCGSKQTNRMKSQSNEITNRKESENINDSKTNRFGFLCENNCSHTSLERVCPYHVPVQNEWDSYEEVVDKFVPEEKSGDGDSSMLEGVYDQSCATDSTLLNENDTLMVKLSSTTNASENPESFSNEESGNLTNVSSLSVKAANVASQWLELLHQDIKGRLAALRRSKKRVRGVISTELPFLISKEFTPNHENDLYLMKSSAEGFSVNATAEMHKARWTALFNQMDHSLSEEEKQLESWLNKVKEMQLHCDQGLQHLEWNSAFGLQQLGTLENDLRSGKADSPEKELAIHAAAASIYSTCNYLMSKENVSCF